MIGLSITTPLRVLLPLDHVGKISLYGIDPDQRIFICNDNIIVNPVFITGRPEFID